MRKSLWIPIVLVSVIAAGCAQIQSLFKKDSGATGAELSGWVRVSISGMVPLWVNDEGYAPYDTADDSGLVLASYGEAPRLDTAGDLAENFARYNACLALRDYTAALFTDALEMTEDDVWSELSNTLMAVDLWDVSIVSVDSTHWEKGYYADETTSQSKGLFAKKSAEPEELFRSYEAVFLTDAQVESIIKSAWNETRSLYTDVLIESVESGIDFLGDNGVVIIDGEVLPADG